MKSTVQYPTQKILITAVSNAILALSLSGYAAITGPYTPDANTVFLLHLNESATAGIAVNAVSGGYNFIAAANPSSSTLRNPMPGILGASGASGPGYNYGNCANLTFSNSVGLFCDANGNEIADLDAGSLGEDSIPMYEFTGPSGEFTLEALVNLPSLAGANREIIAMDTSASPRPFQFRVTTGGQLEFNNIGTAGANPKVSIPTTGSEAFVANQWFHVALSYDGAGTLNFYWTKLDPSRTEATLLQSVTDAPLLNQEGSAVLTIGNENRNTSGEGLLSYIDEVRISNIARTPADMAFNASVIQIPPTINLQPDSQFLGVGETLVIQAHVSGSAPLAYQWQKGAGGTFTPIAGQTGDRLSMPVTFETEGAYRYIVSNSYGTLTSSVAQVTVGAVFSEVFPTGFDDTRTLLDDGSVDPHYFLRLSADPDRLGPDMIVPADVSDYSANDPSSKWITTGATLEGIRGIYTYRTMFLLDSTTPQGAVLSGSILSGGAVRILLNGQPTGIENPTPPFPGPHRNLFSFSITNGFLAGLNTLDFVVDNSEGVANAPGGNALRVTALRGLGEALLDELSIISHPTSQTVREQGKAAFSVVATGRPPLQYQWFADESVLTGATNRTLTLNPVASGGQGTRFTVVASNDSGSVTSQVAVLTLVPNNQPVTVSDLNVAGVKGIPTRIAMSELIQKARDPDSDPITLSTFDSTGTNTTAPATITSEGAFLIYENSADFVGRDRFNVILTDGLGGDAACAVQVQVDELILKIARGPSQTLRLSWPAAATANSTSLCSGDLAAGPITNVVPGTVLTEASESAVYVAPTNRAQFYRLLSQQSGP